ncbi:hypothetical protein ACWDKQ_31465, partial [Saccharopolyspora sp. NPDC000995]
GHGRVVLLDPQKGEEAEDADVLTATGMWVIPVPVPGVGVEGEVVLPPSGSRWRGQDGGLGLPTVVTGPKRRGGVSGPVAGKAGAKDTKRTRGKADQDSREEAGESSRGGKRRKVDTAAAGPVSRSPGDGERGELTPTDQAAQQDPRAERKRKKKEENAKYYRERKAAADRVAVLEGLQEQGPLTGEQKDELAKLQPKAQAWQKKKERDAKYQRAGKAAAARLAELEGLQERGPLSEEQEAALAELQRKVVQKKQKQKERDAKRYRAGKAAADRVAVLEGLQERGLLSEEQEAELAELQPKVAQPKQKHKERAAERYRAGMAAAARVVELEGLQERGQLSEEQEAELAELRPKAQAWQKQKEVDLARYRVGMAAAARVAVLEGLREQGPLTEGQEAELAELRPKAQMWQKKKERDAERYRAGMAAAARVAELEALRGRGPLTEGQEAELAELRPKAQMWQKQKERDAERYRAGMAAAARVAELEALRGRGPLTEGQEAELAELRPKAQAWQKQKERDAERYRAGMAAAARVAVLEGLQERGPLSEEQEAELTELRPKAQAWQKQKERDAERYRAGMAAAARVAVLEGLQERGPLSEEQEAELTELRSKVAGRERKKKAGEVMETGAGGAPMGTGSEGVSGWTGADQDDRDAWSADADLDEWLARAVADVDEVPQGAAGAGVMLDEGAYEEFLETELLAFLGQDADNDAAGADGAGPVAGDDDLAAFLDEEGDSIAWFGGESTDGLSFGEPFLEDEVWPDTGR